MKQKEEMKNLKPIVVVFMLLELSIIGVNAQTPQPDRVSDRQLSKTVRQLERSSAKFRTTLNRTLNQNRSDDRSLENQLNSLERDFENATREFRDRFNRRRTTVADTQNILQKAASLNDVLNENRVSSQVQNDWASVRTNLDVLANAYGLTGQWNRETLLPINLRQSYFLSEGEIDQLIARIENAGDVLRTSLTDAFDKTRYDPTKTEGNMNDAVRLFKSATEKLRNHFDSRQLVAGDVERLIGQATLLEKFMSSNQVTERAQSDWSTLRGELMALAHAYSVDTFWGSTPSSRTEYSGNSRLTGTFRLDLSRSDNPRDRAERAVGNVPENERQDVFGQILVRLESPEMLAIECHGATVTIGSSLAPQSTFEADGRERQEQLDTGRTVRVIATLRGEHLVVSSNGYKENDFNVTFDATEDDRSLKVRRQIYSDRLTQPVVVYSVYDRTADVAQWSVYNGPVLANTGASRADFIVGEGESLVAVLNTDLTTKQAKQGDRFAMTVRLPSQYAGAVIEGTIANVERGRRLSGRSQMSLNFETIRLSDGKTYTFAGIIQKIQTQNGDVQGKDDVELQRGTEVTIRASAPSRQSSL
jgi:hypothetical protein